MKKLLSKLRKESEKSKDAAGKPPSSTSKKKPNRNHHKKKELTPEEIKRKIARERAKNDIIRLYSLKQKQKNQKKARA